MAVLRISVVSEALLDPARSATTDCVVALGHMLPDWQGSLSRLRPVLHQLVLQGRVRRLSRLRHELLPAHQGRRQARHGRRAEELDLGRQSQARLKLRGTWGRPSQHRACAYNYC